MPVPCQGSSLDSPPSHCGCVCVVVFSPVLHIWSCQCKDLVGKKKIPASTLTVLNLCCWTLHVWVTINWKRSIQIYINECMTWIYFPVAPDAIGIDDVLKAWRELVGLVESRRRLFGLHPVQDGRHCGAASLLSNKALTCHSHNSPDDLQKPALLKSIHCNPHSTDWCVIVWYQQCTWRRKKRPTNERELTVPLRRANWMESRSETGHHTSAIRHFWVTSMLQRLSVW